MPILAARVQILIENKIKGANVRKMWALDQVKVQKMPNSLKGAEIWPFLAQGAENDHFLLKVWKSVIILHYIVHMVT